MKKIKIFYNENQNVADDIPLESPSASKPKKLIDLLKRLHPTKLEIISDFKPLAAEMISRAHDPSHTMNVLNATKNNGFGIASKQVSLSFPWTNASFYEAAKAAWNEKTITFSPTSGFHHAGYRTCEGFCTFNGLMIAAILLLEELDIKKIGILDYDAHYGNGTDEIITEKNLQENIIHETFGSYASALQHENIIKCFGTEFKNNDEWLATMRQRMLNAFSECDLIFYQAGADPHINDPYGGFLSTFELKKRDKIVFNTAIEMKKPLVWNLAGGYQKPLQKVLNIHENTFFEAFKALNT